jgi:hypothetical protein
MITLIKEMDNLFTTVDFKYFNSTFSVIFSKENIEGFEKIIKYLFSIKNYNNYLKSFIQVLEKKQYNPSFIFIDKIIYDDTSIFNDPTELYDNAKKLKNNDIVEYMKIINNLHNLFIVVSCLDDTHIKKVIENINNEKVYIFDTKYFEEDKPKLESVLKSQKQYFVSSSKTTMSMIILKFFAMVDVSFIYLLLNIKDLVYKYYGEYQIRYINDYPYYFISIDINIEPRFVKDVLNDIFKYIKDIKVNLNDIEDARKKRILNLDYNLSNTDLRHNLIIREYQKYKPNFDFRSLREHYQNLKLKDVKEELNKLFQVDNMKLFLIGVPFKDNINVNI